MTPINKLLLIGLLVFVVSSRLLDENEVKKEGEENKPAGSTDEQPKIEGGEPPKEGSPEPGKEVGADANKPVEKKDQPGTEGHSRKFLLIGLAVVFLGAGVLGAAYFLKKKNSSE